MDILVNFSEITKARLEFWTDVIEHYEKLLRAEICAKKLDAQTCQILFQGDPGRMALVQTRERVRSLAIPEEIIIVADDETRTMLSPLPDSGPPLS